MRVFVHLPWALLLVIVMISACSKPEVGSTRLYVRVRGDYEQDEIERIDLEIQWLTKGELASRRARSDVFKGADAKLPLSFGVKPWNGDELDKEALISLTLIPKHPKASPHTTRARAAFAKNRVRLVDLFLEKACATVECGRGASCTHCGVCLSHARPQANLKTVSVNDVDLDEPAAMCLGVDSDSGLDLDAGVDGSTTVTPALDGSISDGGNDGEGGTLPAPESDASTMEGGMPPPKACDGKSYACIKEVRSSSPHTCAVTEKGALYCTSTRNTCGEVGLPAADSIPFGFRKILERGVKHVGLAFRVTCVITDGSVWSLPEGSVVCWGDNQSGQLATTSGVASTSCGIVPTQGPNGLPEGAAVVTGIPPAKIIEGYEDQVYVIGTDDKLYGWGNNLTTKGPHGSAFTWQALGRGRLLTAQRSDGRFTGPFDDYRAQYWGEKPLAMAVEGGGWGGCVILPDTSIECGESIRDPVCGELGRLPNFAGAPTDQCVKPDLFSPPMSARAPVEMPAGVSNLGFSALSTIGGSFCAIRNGGELWCWGFNQEGSLGLGPALNYKPVWTPTRVDPERADFVDVAPGDLTCAIRRDRSLWCAGLGASTYLSQFDLPVE